MDPLLSIENLVIDFVKDSTVTNAVKNVSLQVHAGEIVALVGESGSGKSVTSLSILQLLPVPPARYTSGKILFHVDGSIINLLSSDAKQIRKIRGNKIGMIFQEPMSSLNPLMKCGEQIAESLRIHKNLSRKQIKLKVLEWLNKVQLPSPEIIYNKYPHELSGGQKQRIMIAMAMCCEPALLICDEPTTALDVTVQKTILELIKKLQQQNNTGVLFISHDLGVVAEIADRVAILYKGEKVEENNVNSIFHNAQHPYTKGLIACRPALHPKGEPLPTIQDFLVGKEKQSESKKSINTISSSSLLLEVKDLTIQFPAKKNIIGNAVNYFTAVDDVSFSILEGETVGLVGESGCGKTTLGRALLGLVPPTNGSIKYKNTEITNLSNHQLKSFRKEVQLVFQDPFSSLNPKLIIGDAIAEPIIVTQSISVKERKKRINELLSSVKLPESFSKRYPHEFSGGQRQRIVIARALSLNPTFLVCDESVSALDVSVQAEVLNLLNELKRKLGLTMLFISHDLSVVRYMCDKILVMEKGKIVERGNAEEVYRNPKTLYTQKLIESIPKI